MKLLARTARDLRRLWTADLGVTVLVGTLAAALEVVGRQTAHGGYDLHDLLALFTVFLLGVIVVARPRRSPLGWVAAASALGRRAGAWLRHGTFEIGLDLRGTP